MFDVSPASAEVAVGHGSYEIAKPFQVTSLLLSSRWSSLLNLSSLEVGGGSWPVIADC